MDVFFPGSSFLTRLPRSALEAFANDMYADGPCGGGQRSCRAVRWSVCNAADVLERVQLVEGLMEIGEDCFMATQIAEVTFPASLTTIGNNAFGFEFSLSLNGGTLLRAIFKGDAPAVMGENVFADQASEFVVNYLESSSGFTQPMWQGNRSHEVAVLPSDTLEQEGDFTYRVIDDEVEIVGFPNDSSGHVEIPAMIAGKPVTGITGAYRGNDFEAAFEFAMLIDFGDDSRGCRGHRVE